MRQLKSTFPLNKPQFNYFKWLGKNLIHIGVFFKRVNKGFKPFGILWMCYMVHAYVRFSSCMLPHMFQKYTCISKVFHALHWIIFKILKGNHKHDQGFLINLIFCLIFLVMIHNDNFQYSARNFHILNTLYNSIITVIIIIC